MPRPDEVLLRATRDGEPEAFGEFYERRRALVLAYLRVRVLDAETAGDLLGETFAAALLDELCHGFMWCSRRVSGWGARGGG